MRRYQPADPPAPELRVCNCSLPYEQCCGARDRMLAGAALVVPTVTTDHTTEEVTLPPEAAKKDDDKVNPKHYASWAEYSAVVIIRRWNKVRAAMGLEPVSFNVGNAIKYIQRAGTKPGESEVVDLKKAVWYLQNRIHELDPAGEPDPAKVD